ncbi:unnamed protein product [Closterium sp. NIES-53]
MRSTGDPRLILRKGYRHVVLGGDERTDPLLNKPFYPNGLVVGILTEAGGPSSSCRLLRRSPAKSRVLRSESEAGLDEFPLLSVGVGAIVERLKFGETESIPFFTDTWQPDSFYDRIIGNAARDLHTLCLLGNPPCTCMAPLFPPPCACSAPPSPTTRLLCPSFPHHHCTAHRMQHAYRLVCMGRISSGHLDGHIASGHLDGYIASGHLDGHIASGNLDGHMSLSVCLGCSLCTHISYFLSPCLLRFLLTISPCHFSSSIFLLLLLHLSSSFLLAVTPPFLLFISPHHSPRPPDIKVKEPSLEAMARWGWGRGRIEYEAPRYMSVNTAIRQLLLVEEKRQQRGEDCSKVRRSAARWRVQKATALAHTHLCSCPHAPLLLPTRTSSFAHMHLFSCPHAPLLLPTHTSSLAHTHLCSCPHAPLLLPTRTSSLAVPTTTCLLLCVPLTHPVLTASLAVCTPDSLCVGVARLGADSQCIVFGSMQQLSDVDFGPPLHSLVLCGALHELEKDFLDASLDAFLDAFRVTDAMLRIEADSTGSSEEVESERPIL